MSVPITSRLVLRHSRLFTRHSIRRYASAAETASNAASKTKGAASNVTSKASEGLSKVTSAAGPAVKGIAEGVQTRVAGLTGRAMRLVAFVESMIPPTIYYSKVGFELAKLTFQGQKMYPPSTAAFQEYFTMLIQGIRNPARTQKLIVDNLGSLTRSASELGPGGVMNSIRNLNSGDVLAVGVIGLQFLGFFTVGEMIGKFKVVGYRGGSHEPEH